MSFVFTAPKSPRPLPPVAKPDDPDVRRREEERLAMRRERPTIPTGGPAKGGETGPGLEETPTVFGLEGRVGPGLANNSGDVKATKRALALARYYPDVFAWEADGGGRFPYAERHPRLPVRPWPQGRRLDGPGRPDGAGAGAGAGHKT